MIIVKHYYRTRCVYGKGHLNDSTNCRCPIPYYKSGVFAFILNRYPEELKKYIRLTERKHNSSTENI